MLETTIFQPLVERLSLEFNHFTTTDARFCRFCRRSFWTENHRKNTVTLRFFVYVVLPFLTGNSSFFTFKFGTFLSLLTGSFFSLIRSFRNSTNARSLCGVGTSFLHRLVYRTEEERHCVKEAGPTRRSFFLFHALRGGITIFCLPPLHWGQAVSFASSFLGSLSSTFPEPPSRGRLHQNQSLNPSTFPSEKRFFSISRERSKFCYCLLILLEYH
jgi:hypothetical protein